MKKIFFFCLLISISCLLQAQVSAKSELQHLKEKYGANSDFSADLNYQWFEGCASTPNEVMLGKVVKSTDKQYMKIGNVETLTNEKYTIIADNDKKMVLLANASENTSSAMQVDWDKIQEAFTKIEITSKDANTNILTLSSNYGAVHSYEFVYNPSDYVLKKITCHVASETSTEKCKMSKIVITYQNVTFETINPSAFSEQKYLLKGSKGISLQGNYKNYQLVNNLR